MILGLDFGSQSLKACVVDRLGAIVHEASVAYGEDCIQRHVDGRVTTKPVVWIGALEELLAALPRELIAQIRFVTGGAQQHGVVCWKRSSALGMLSEADTDASLIEILQDAFSVPDAPIWMSSADASMFEEACGGPEGLAQLTGSSGHGRFSGPQLRRIRIESPEQWDLTEHISLVSSFAASILTGRYAPTDFGDASGMNLLDIEKRRFDPRLLKVVSDDCGDKLGAPASSMDMLGPIAPFFYRFGFSELTQCQTFSGDNLNSVAALQLELDTTLAISLGTSDTVFSLRSQFTPLPSAHVFLSAVDNVNFVTLVCFSNGSLTRELIRDEFAQGSWEEFNRQLTESPPGSGIMIAFQVDEITPVCSKQRAFFDTNGEHVEKLDFICKAMIEGQMMRLKLYSNIESPKHLIAIGGASANKAILQIMANVFGCPVYVSASACSAAYGSCLRALSEPWPLPKHELVCLPNMNLHDSVYVPLTQLYASVAATLSE